MGLGPRGRTLVATLHGDLYEIRKNLVAMIMQGAGLEVEDLRIDVSPGRFVGAVSEHSPDLRGLSALLTATMPKMWDIVYALVAAGPRGSFTVMVGGGSDTGR